MSSVTFTEAESTLRKDKNNGIGYIDIQRTGKTLASLYQNFTLLEVEWHRACIEKILREETIMASDILTSKQLGKRWHVSTETLRYWRWNATGPVYVKFNGCIRYRLDDIDQFEQAHLRRHTADGVFINGMEGKMG